MPRQNAGGASAGAGAAAGWHELEDQVADADQGNNGYVTVDMYFLQQKTMDADVGNTSWERLGETVFAWQRVQHLPPAVRQGLRVTRFNIERSLSH